MVIETVRTRGMWLLAFSLLTLAVGCSGPTRTAGTQGIPAEKLSLLHVTKQYDVPVMQLAAIGFDGGEKYQIDGDRDFYLTPGVHHVAIDLSADIDSPVPFLSLGSTKIEGPKGLTTGNLQPGKTYELRGLTGTLEGMVGGGEMGVTREMTAK